MIDVFSDNVTKPTPEMIDAMARVIKSGESDDKLIQQLEDLAAEVVAKEAALLMPTATQGNLVAILCQADRGQEVIMGPDSHIYESEMGGAGIVGGVMVKTWNGKGTPSVQAFCDVCDPDFRYSNGSYPRSALICLENAHNSAGGEVISQSKMYELCTIARKTIPKIHLDGARIFNAAASLHTTAKELTAEVDTVVFSLDKGLSAPYGALLCGPEAIITKAKEWRRLLGGFVRKAGILAAAGIVAVEKMIDRVGEDNARASSIGNKLATIKGLIVDPYPVPSNLVMLSIKNLSINPLEFVARLEKEYGIRAHIFGRQTIRLAVHRHIGEKEEIIIVESIKDLVSKTLLKP